MKPVQCYKNLMGKEILFKFQMEDIEYANHHFLFSLHSSINILFIFDMIIREFKFVKNYPEFMGSLVEIHNLNWLQRATV